MDDWPPADRVREDDPGLAGYFLGRLAALLIRQTTAAFALDRRVLSRAVFSTLLDCIDLGLTARAREIVTYVRDTILPDDRPAA